MTAGNRIDVLLVLHEVALLLEETPVFQSQLGGLMLALRKKGYSVGILAPASDTSRFEAVIGERLRSAGCEIFFVPHTGFWRNTLALAGELRRLLRQREIGTAYVRGIWGAVVIALAGALKRLPYAYDVRGDLADETLASGTLAQRRALYLRMERWALRHAAKVSAVSSVLARRLEAAHSLPDVTVIPCCVNTESMTADPTAAQRWRDRIAGPQDVVLAYSGGISHYQQLPEMFELWRGLAGEANLVFLFMTNTDPSKLSGLGDLTVFGDRLKHFVLKQAEVAPALAAADLGFMLRDDRPLNHAASPVKFPEYLCAGLSVVGSPGTGDASALIEKESVGVLVDPGNVLDGLEAVRSLIAERRHSREVLQARSRNLALEAYDWSSFGAEYASLYGKPGGKGQS